MRAHIYGSRRMPPTQSNACVIWLPRSLSTTPNTVAGCMCLTCKRWRYRVLPAMDGYVRCCGRSKCLPLIALGDQVLVIGTQHWQPSSTVHDIQCRLTLAIVPVNSLTESEQFLVCRAFFAPSFVPLFVVRMILSYLQPFFFGCLPLALIFCFFAPLFRNVSG